MENTYKELKTDMELLTAALLQVLVAVVDENPFDPDELVEPGGVVEAYTPLKVQVNGEWYARKYCSFRITI